MVSGNRTPVGNRAMNTDARVTQSPESYSTFWEPIATIPAPTLTAAPASSSPTDAKDAYLEFTEVTEGVPARRSERT
jgi:hypothetical protein